MAGTLPRPYMSDVKKDESIMVYIPTETMGIGARRSGLPKESMNGVKSLDHVGSSAGKGKSAGK
jgi:hypothetical protein